MISILLPIRAVEGSVLKNLLLITALISVISIPSSWATETDQPINENPVAFKARIEPKEVPAGGKAKLIIDMNVAEGHHAYKDMFKVDWKGAEGVVVDHNYAVHPIHEFEDTNSKKIRQGVEGKGTLTAMIQVPADFSLGAQAGKFVFTYQACHTRYCLFPKESSIDLPFTVVAATADKGGSKNEFEKALAKGKIWAFFFAFVGGFLTSLTPCVFPMIPITISIIGARSAQNKRSRSFALSVSYVLGIGLTYALLGVVAASTGAFFGSALSNVWVVSTIAMVFVAMGLSMLGLFEMQVPAAIRNKFGNADTGTGLPGAFGAGLFAGIVASPCIGPVLVTILTYVAQTAEVVFGFFLLFTFAMGMGLLFIGLGTFSGLLTKMPKAGGWMEVIKVTFGFTFIAMAFYYLAPVTPKNVYYILIAVAVFVASSYYGAFAQANTPKEQVRKGLCLASFFGGIFLMASVIFGELGYSPEAFHASRNPSSVVTEPKTSSLAWVDYSEELVAKAAQEKRPVIIDFHAEWCVACHELEKFTFTDAGVQATSKSFTLLSVDATKSSDAVNALKKKYGVVGLPTIIFIDAQGNVSEKQTVTGFVKADDFLNRMKEAL
jgi:thioredoxin:protein disulfide reductase